ncbi:MAG TPA: hypothetical protein VIJ28_17525 [Chloroflexota bacterium]
MEGSNPTQEALVKEILLLKDEVRSLAARGRRPRRPWGAVLVTAALCATLLGTNAFASGAGPASLARINACYAKAASATGEHAVFLLTGTQAGCATGEIAISWNQQGTVGITWKGQWATSVHYNLNDIVFNGGSEWIATVPNTSSAPSSLNSNWGIFLPPGSAGPTGATGPQGAQGPSGLTWRGSWSSGATYNANDVVLDNNSEWIATASSTGVEPANASSGWSLFVPQGPQGPQGIQGPPGPSGPRGAQGCILLRANGQHPAIPSCCPTASVRPRHHASAASTFVVGPTLLNRQTPRTGTPITTVC